MLFIFVFEKILKVNINILSLMKVRMYDKIQLTKLTWEAKQDTFDVNSRRNKLNILGEYFSNGEFVGLWNSAFVFFFFFFVAYSVLLCTWL